ncbi:MAG: alpha/beta hydrolase [Rhizomicrobium sp.]
MPEQSSRPRRPELDRVFQHLAGLAAGVDLSGIGDPQRQWLTAMRATLSRYGDVGPAVSLEGITFAPVVANGVAAEWVTAEGASQARRIVYIHGGGWSGGSPLDYRPLSATLARLSGASILMVDYRLAPEHPFPAGLEDCVKAFDWALANGPASGKAGLAGRDPAERISVAGDSAGGNLSAALCVRLAERGARMPDRLVLIAGTLDNVSMSERIGLDDPVCTPEVLSFSVSSYLSSSQSAADPLVSPVFAPMAILGKFPPTLIQVSTSEALLHDSKTFADRLERARVRVNLSLWPDLPHIWHAFLAHLPEAAEALGEVADFTNR